MANPDKIKMSVQEMGNLSFDPVFNQNAVELLGFDGKNLQRLNANNLALQLDYVGGANPIYIGNAAPGSATSEGVWKIQKLTFDGNNNVTAILFAGGSSGFNQTWDDRESYIYS